MKRFIVLLAILSLSGCAQFSTVQTDTRDGTKTTITTKATSRTFFDSKSNLARWKAQQTEKSQGAEVGGLVQESSGTNAVNLIEAAVGAAVRAATRP